LETVPTASGQSRHGLKHSQQGRGAPESAAQDGWGPLYNDVTQKMAVLNPLTHPVRLGQVP